MGGKCRWHEILTSNERVKESVSSLETVISAKSPSPSALLSRCLSIEEPGGNRIIISLLAFGESPRSTVRDITVH